MTGARITNSQSLSNMLRRRYVLGALLLGLFVVECTAEPTNRRNRMGFIIDDNPVIVDCAGSRADSSECRAVNQNGSTAAAVAAGNEGNVEKDEESWSLTELLNDDGVDEARGKKGKKKGMGKVLFMIGAAMKATLMYVMIHAVALLAGKALVVAKVALVLAATIALKKALERPDKTSYEIVKHPQHSYSQTHSSSVDYDHHGSGIEGHRRKRRFAR